jgi:nitroreductase
MAGTDFHPTAQELLSTRRSIRSFTDEPVTNDILWKIVESCRYCPTSRNSQAYTLHVIRDRKTLDWLAARRIPNSGPIGRAGTAVAVVSDPSGSRRHIQDGCIAAYHFCLAAWLYGLGTCWIAAMDREDVKIELGIPQDHYIATITPLGYPAEMPRTPGRRPKEAMVVFHEP